MVIFAKNTRYSAKIDMFDTILAEYNLISHKQSASAAPTAPQQSTQRSSSKLNKKRGRTINIDDSALKYLGCQILPLAELRVKIEKSLFTGSLDLVYDRGCCSLLLNLLPYKAPEEILGSLVILLSRSVDNSVDEL